MSRVSNYNIYLKMKKQIGKYLVIQGYRGSFDVIDESIAEILERAEKDSSLLDSISPENKEILSKRGYITDLSEEEEYKFIEKLSHALNAVDRKNILITLMPTYNCNFRCEYCFERELFTKGEELLSEKMSKELVDAVFNQIKKYKDEGLKVSTIYFFGGEPLLRTNKDIVTYICEKSKEEELNLGCVTNGYDLDKYVDLIDEYGFKHVQITIDGIKEEHDKRRYLAGGQGTYDKITANIDLALEKGIPISLRTNVNKKNIEAIDELIEEYKKQGWTEKKNFSYYFKTTLKCYEEVGNALSDVELMNQLTTYFGEDASRFRFNSIYNGVADKLNYMLKNNGFAPMRSGFCGANTGMYTVDPFGDIYACWDVLQEEDCKIGKVDIEKGEFVLNDIHDEWKDRTVDRIDDCKKCKYMLFCGGGCSAQARVMNNDMNKVFCDDYSLLFDEVAVDVCEKFLELEPK